MQRLRSVSAVSLSRTVAFPTDHSNAHQSRSSHSHTRIRSKYPYPTQRDTTPWRRPGTVLTLPYKPLCVPLGQERAIQSHPYLDKLSHALQASCPLQHVPANIKKRAAFHSLGNQQKMYLKEVSKTTPLGGETKLSR